MRRTRSQSASGGNPRAAAAGPSAEVARRRRASPAAKGKSPVTKVETASPLGNARRKGRPKTESKDNSSVETCSAGSCEKNNLEEQMESLDNNDAAEMDWEEGHVEHIEYSDELRETITVEFNDVPSSTNKKSIRRPTAEEKELAELVRKVHLLCLIARGRVVDKACNDTLIQASILSLVPYHLLWSLSDVPNLKAVNLHSLVSWVCALSVALFRALNLTASQLGLLQIWMLLDSSLILK